MKKRIAAISSAAILTIAVLFLLQQLLVPKYMSEIYEGAMIGEYYDEVKQGRHQVLFVGDCELYENISPITLYQEYGITSYIRGSAQQLVWQSYYLLEDALRYETPDVVVFSVLAMKFNEPQNEAYNRMSIDGMRLSPSKIGAIMASKVEQNDEDGTQGESVLSYLFPLLRYHDRWKELTMDDVKYMFRRPKVTHNGFMMRCDVKPVTRIPEAPPLPDYQFGEKAYEYLDKITALCKQKGIPLVLVKAPSLYPHWYPEWEQQIIDYADKHDLLYINTLELQQQIGLTFTGDKADTYDGGLHLNCAGAEKVARYLGKELQSRYNLPDMRKDPDTQKVWDKKIAAYQQMKAAQLQEIATDGKVKTFLVPAV